MAELEILRVSKFTVLWTRERRRSITAPRSLIYWLISASGKPVLSKAIAPNRFNPSIMLSSEDGLGHWGAGSAWGIFLTIMAPIYTDKRSRKPCGIRERLCRSKPAFLGPGQAYYFAPHVRSTRGTKRFGRVSDHQGFPLPEP